MRKIFTNSIKQKLIIRLSLLISTILILVAIISFNATKHEIGEVFDSNMVKTAKLLLNLSKHEILEHETNDNFIIDLGISDMIALHKYEYKTHFQIWKNEYLIYSSSADIKTEKPKSTGFKNITLNEKNWNSFVLFDKDSNIVIEILEQEEIRHELIDKILITLILSLTLSLIPIIIIIYAVTNKGLSQLTSLSHEIKNRSPLLLTPFKNSKKLPNEVKPLVDSLNFLLVRLDESMNIERQFIDYASHELRTPLSAIKTKTQFLIRKYENSEFSKELENLLEAINRTIKISNQLLVLSRISNKDGVLEKEELNLSNITAQVAASFYQSAKSKNIDITAQIEDGCFLLANREHIEIIFSNLLENAIKYSQNSNNIYVKLENDAENIILSVTNKGQTLSKEEQLKIFDRFYRTHGNKESGSGLGLSIVKKIVDLYNAKISFSSKDGVNCVTLEFKKDF